MSATVPCDAAAPAIQPTLNEIVAAGITDWSVPVDAWFDRHAPEARDLTWHAWATIPWWGPLETIFTGTPQWTDIVIDPPGYDVLVKSRSIALFVGSGIALHETWVRWLQTRLGIAVGSIDPDDQDRWHIHGMPTHAIHGTVGRRMRFAITRPPYSPEGRTIVLRALPTTWPSLSSLVLDGVLTRDAAEFLTEASFRGATILVAGLTGSGKTTLTAALLLEVSAKRRVIVIEDAIELPRPPYSGHSVEVLTGGTSFAACVRFSLRQNPDMIVVGEVRGSEAFALLTAAATGHPGIGTIHAPDTRSAVLNLERLAISEPGVSPDQVRSLLTGGSVPLVVVSLGTMNGKRRVTEIIEVLASRCAPTDPIPYNQIFEWDAHRQTLMFRYHPNGSWWHAHEAH